MNMVHQVCHIHFLLLVESRKIQNVLFFLTLTSAPPEPQVKVIRLPKKRPADQLARLKERLKTLKCFSERDSEDGPVVRVSCFVAAYWFIVFQIFCLL